MKQTNTDADFKKVLAMIKAADDVDLMKMHRLIESEAKIRGHRKTEQRKAFVVDDTGNLEVI